jgi:hypothetical protein
MSCQGFDDKVEGATDRNSTRKVELLQENGKSRVVVQALQKRFHFRMDQTVVTLDIGSVQPLERFVGLVPESINLGDLVGANCLVFRNQLPQSCVRLFFRPSAWYAIAYRNARTGS